LLFSRHSLFLFLAFVSFCSCPAAAQQPPQPQVAAKPADDLTQRIESNVRARFRVPSRVNVTVGERHPSEFPGYDAVTVTLSEGQRSSPYEFLLSKDGKTLVQLVHIDISQAPMAVAGRPMRGAPDAKVTIIVYDDFQCPYCAKGYAMLFSEIFPQYKDKIRVVYKDFPLVEIHPWAIHAAVDANCLFDQSNDAYWDFADYVHGNQQEIRGDKRAVDAQLSTLDHSALGYGQKYHLDIARLESCVKTQDEKAVRASMKYGEDSLGIDSTPTLFVNGEKLEGAVPGDEFRKVLDAALREAGVEPPANSSSPKVNSTPGAEAVKDRAQGVGVAPAGPSPPQPAAPAQKSAGVPEKKPPAPNR
jgi:protein-disulfide isomerase